jgi:LemA protein
MKKTAMIVILVIVVIVAVIGFSLVGTYNGLATARENVDNSLGNIQTQLQRRADLIPNLVETVKGYAAHESEVMQAVSDARAKLAGAQTPEEMAQADGELTGALSRLLMVAENYPDLKADATFTSLMDELAGTENRIAVARTDYNDVVRQYNSMLVRFPKNLVAAMFGFEKGAYFEAQEGAEDAPTVDFSE